MPCRHNQPSFLNARAAAGCYSRPGPGARGRGGQALTLAPRWLWGPLRRVQRAALRGFSALIASCCARPAAYTPEGRAACAAAAPALRTRSRTPNCFALQSRRRAASGPQRARACTRVPGPLSTSVRARTPPWPGVGAPPDLARALAPCARAPPAPLYITQRACSWRLGTCWYSDSHWSPGAPWQLHRGLSGGGPAQWKMHAFAEWLRGRPHPWVLLCAPQSIAPIGWELCNKPCSQQEQRASRLGGLCTPIALGVRCAAPASRQSCMSCSCCHCGRVQSQHQLHMKIHADKSAKRSQILSLKRSSRALFDASARCLQSGQLCISFTAAAALRASGPRAPAAAPPRRGSIGRRQPPTQGRAVCTSA